MFQSLLSCAKDIAGAGPMGFFKVSSISFCYWNLIVIIVLVLILRYLNFKQQLYLLICFESILQSLLHQLRSKKTAAQLVGTAHVGISFCS